MIVTLKDFEIGVPLTHIEGHGWFPAKPLEYKTLTQRFKESWLVFTGKADPFIWPEDLLK